MSTIPIYPNQRRLAPSPLLPLNPLPELLRTPSGLALLELQGTINLPQQDLEGHTSRLHVDGNDTSQETSIGRLVFPDYYPSTQEPNSTAWMKRVYLYVGKHQRLTGEVKKLPKAIAILRKRHKGDMGGNGLAAVNPGDVEAEELEIVEIVKWKILFSQRPEPVGTWNGERASEPHIPSTWSVFNKHSNVHEDLQLYSLITKHQGFPNMASPPETYYLTTPTPHVPNSPLPVLVYRAVLPASPTPQAIRSALEANNWMQGGVFKHYPAHHFHSVTHECYAVFKGSSRLLLGRGPLDGNGQGVEVSLSVGDAIVLPAGVAHCCLESKDEYEYVGLYPEGSPHWDNNFCRASVEETREKATNAKTVPIPEYDPITGKDGYLVSIWRAALSAAEG